MSALSEGKMPMKHGKSHRISVYVKVMSVTHSQMLFIEHPIYISRSFASLTLSDLN